VHHEGRTNSGPIAHMHAWYYEGRPNWRSYKRRIKLELSYIDRRETKTSH
jgi:hypothetical protein